jgi:hypothetical protein
MSAKKIGLLLLIALVVGLFFLLGLDRHLTLESLKENRDRLLALYEGHRLLFVGGYVLVYIVQTAFSLPGRPHRPQWIVSTASPRELQPAVAVT